jgi:hypothetical protein
MKIQEETIKFRIMSDIESISRKLIYIDQKIYSLNQIILEDTNNLKLLLTNDSFYLQRIIESPTLNQVLFDYKNSLIDYEYQKIELSSRLEKLNTSLTDSTIFNEKQIEELNTEGDIEILNLQQNLQSLRMEFDRLDNKNLETPIIFELRQKRATFLGDLELAAQGPIDTMVTKEIVTTTIEIQKQFYIILSLFFGLIFSIALVIVKDIFTTLEDNII